MNIDIVTCPRCGAIVGFNSYFRRYMCTSCTWTSGIIEWEDCSSTKNAEETATWGMTATWRMTKIMFRGKDCYENGN